jgi:hypothetical protein
MDDECGAMGAMLGRGNRSTRRKPALMPLCQRQIPHDLTRAAAMANGKPVTNRLSYGVAESRMLLL